MVLFMIQKASFIPSFSFEFEFGSKTLDRSLLMFREHFGSFFRIFLFGLITAV